MKFAKETFTILCDDIRQEIGNKISLMGIYGRDIVVPQIPFVFPKLCLFLMAKEVPCEINDLKIIITVPQSDPITLDLPAPPNQKIPQDIHVGITISPLTLNGEGKAKIEIFRTKERKPIISHLFNIVKTK
jgi:hypothetical protein